MTNSEQMQTDQIVDIISRTLKEFPEVRFSTLFGSAVQGRMSARSDIDIAVAGERRFSAEFKVRLAQALAAGLKREVDLVDLQSVSGLILEQALCKAVIAKNADPELYARLLKRLWYDQADMVPYVRKILEERTAQWLR
ncbi:type VII toxin-antitoxin system MntA family adenylyltransferase antitoxin [Geoalkalibacter halelectricus]|uniref:Nucleotidyltransferase domain-containing protein n=1 Tax=Geoalkalibacter halelectricus TaxID=2847045 RepID=A0ABY5ZLT5_9BACT|nr:nucleotidyltransferase domain-containing protein [Geoalkalibacter halelectricus]MDO3379714.1 nucleotidyltransferase domain-containing protein [Geoalkalibacter halelectricus]UWZ79676.1 nucleotidyltransferase domain-containing protein [Geoalkalibacter halelectricus]